MAGVTYRNQTVDVVKDSHGKSPGQTHCTVGVLLFINVVRIAGLPVGCTTRQIKFPEEKATA